MKKIITIFIVLFALFMFSACKKNNQEPTKKTENVPTQEVISSSEKTPTHNHNLVYHPSASPTFFNGGSDTEYYYCPGCNKYFDALGNEITPNITPRLSTALLLGVNGEIKGEFSVDESELEIEHIFWEIKNISLEKDDVITIHKKDDTSVTYDFYADTNSNITSDNKVHNDVSNATINISGTPNGLYLSISGLAFEGIVIKINDTEYPMNKVSYLESGIETYIFGYFELSVNDKVVIIDKDNNITYDYDDFDDNIKWNTFDFHKGDNEEIIFDYNGRFGFEFDKGGDKKISITKVFAPINTSEVAINYSSDKDNKSLEKYEIKKTDPVYNEALWYINHECVINSSDIVSFIEENGFYMFIESFNLSENEMFNLKDLTNENIITGDHLVDVSCQDLTGNFSIEGDYIKVLKSGNYSISYIPSISSISIYENSASFVSAYILDGTFIELNSDELNNVHYEMEVTSEFGETLMFTDGSYKALNVTLDSSVDSSCITIHENGAFVLTKKGTYKLSLNLDTLVLNVEFTIAKEETPQVTNLVLKFYDSNGGQSSSFSPEFLINSDNVEEYCLLNYTVQNGWLALVDFSSGSMETIEDATLVGDSSLVMNISYFFIIQAGKTCNFYYNPTTKTLSVIEATN